MYKLASSVVTSKFEQFYKEKKYQVYIASMKPRAVYELVIKILKRPRTIDEIKLCTKLLIEKNYVM